MAEETLDLPPWKWPTGPGATRFYALQCELERSLRGRRCVFLDVNFWIDCREAKFNADADGDKKQLYRAMLRAVGEHRLICPITSDVLTELTKQNDEAFAATMAVVDELTLGVAMVPHRERLIIEVERFLGGSSGVPAAVHRPIWTAFVYAFGYQDLWPPGPVMRSDELLLAMTDIGWGWPPSKGVSALRRAVTNAKEESERVAETLNRGAEANRGGATGYTAILRDELAGAADLISGHLAAEYDRMAASAGARPGDERLRRTLTRMAALGMGKSEGRKAFGSIVVPATLHAAFRAEKGRRFKPNDIFDFRHAAAALPNCDAFFTEGKLSRFMASGHVGLAKSYPCRIAATPGDALKTLQSMDLI